MMNDREIRRYEAFKRIVAFWTEPNQPNRVLAPQSKGGEALAELQTIVASLQESAASKIRGTSDRSGGTTAKSVLADALRQDLANLARTARSIDDDEPGFADAYRMPRPLTYATLEAAAQSVLTRLADPAVAGRFAAHDLPADFVQDLAADLAAFRSAEDDQSAGLDQQVTGTAALSARIAEGMKRLRRLDAIAHNRFATDAATLAAWLSAARIERAPRSKPEPQPGPAA